MSRNTEIAIGQNASSENLSFRKQHNSRFEKLLSVLSAQYEFLKASQCPRSLIEDHARLLRYLSSMNFDEIQKIVSSPNSAKGRPVTDVPDDSIRKLSLPEVEALLQDEKITRAALERIATIRFFVTRGDLSSTPNREVLIERIKSMIENERTRLTIQKLAAGLDAQSR